MIPNSFGIAMMVLFIGGLVAGLLLLATQLYLTFRHFVYLRRVSSSWAHLFSLFNRNNTHSESDVLPPEGVKNLALTRTLQRVSLYIFLVMIAAFVSGALWGGWMGNSA
jgi:hypothetical protein